MFSNPTPIKPGYDQLAIEQKSTTIGLIIYKHSTRTKLRHLAREKTGGKLPNPWGNKEILDSSPTLIPLFNTRNHI